MCVFIGVGGWVYMGVSGGWGRVGRSAPSALQPPPLLPLVLVLRSSMGHMASGDSTWLSSAAAACSGMVRGPGGWPSREEVVLAAWLEHSRPNCAMNWLPGKKKK